MRGKKIYLSLIATLVGIAFCITPALITSAHPPSAMPIPAQRTYSHIHVKGRVTTEEGVGIPGVRVHVRNSAMQGVSTYCFQPGVVSTYSDTDTNGNYDCRVLIKTDTSACRAGFDSATIDRSQMELVKSGYDFRIKPTMATIAPSD